MGVILSYVSLAIEIYSWALIIYILMSWFPNSRETTFGQFMASICEPYLEPFRRIIPPIGMIDISAIAAIFALFFAQIGIQQLAYMI